jgi:nicotinate-nucleotide adenylyltransferase
MMQNWMKPQVIFDQCSVVVAGRDYAQDEQILKHIEFLKENFNADIIYVKMPTIQISSEDIRHRIENGKTVKYFLPDQVIDYIKDNNLYITNQEV